jgi:hypothetical protein
MIEPFKYLIQAVCVERDESGRIVAEKTGEILHVYSAAQAVEAITEFEAQLERLGKEKEGDDASRNGERRDDQLRQPIVSGEQSRSG